MNSTDQLANQLAEKLIRMLPHKTDHTFWTNSYTVRRVATAVKALGHDGLRDTVIASVTENLDEVGKHFWSTKSKTPSMRQASTLLGDAQLTSEILKRDQVNLRLAETETAPPQPHSKIAMLLESFDSDHDKIVMHPKRVHKFVDLCLTYRPAPSKFNEAGPTRAAKRIHGANGNTNPQKIRPATRSR